MEHKQLEKIQQDYRTVCGSLEHHTQDGRPNTQELLDCITQTRENLELILITHQRAFDENGKVICRLPIFGLRSNTDNIRPRQKANYIIAGIHGEEPAGPIATTNLLDELDNHAKTNPLIVVPLANPGGYYRDWRYSNKKRGRGGKPIGDPDNYLINPSTNRPYSKRASSAEAEAFSRFFINNWDTHQPHTVIDLHEDEDDQHNERDVEPYIYSQGKLGYRDPVAKEIVRTIKEMKMPIKQKGFTRFGEAIKGGIVSGTLDRTIDDFLTRTTFWNGEAVQNKQVARHMITVETPTLGISLHDRVEVHQEIIRRTILNHTV